MGIACGTRERGLPRRSFLVTSNEHQSTPATETEFCFRPRFKPKMESAHSPVPGKPVPVSQWVKRPSLLEALQTARRLCYWDCHLLKFLLLEVFFLT